MIEIGINEGYKLSRVTVNDKGSIEAYLTKGDSSGSLLDMLAAETAVEESMILLFPPNMLKYNSTEQKSPEEIVSELRTAYRVFYRIFNMYAPKEDVEKAYPVTSIYNGISITKENEGKLLATESKIKQMWENIGIAAQKAIISLDLASKASMRIKMVRQSKNKPYPAFTQKPDRDDWCELDIIPVEQTSVKFTDWEIGKGYNSALPPIADKVADPIMNAFKKSAQDIPESSIEDNTSELPYS